MIEPPVGEEKQRLLLESRSQRRIANRAIRDLHLAICILCKANADATYFCENEKTAPLQGEKIRRGEKE
jgi:hypothetical protein